MDVAKSKEVGIIDGSDNCEDETVKRLSSKNLNRVVRYLILTTRLVFTQLKKALTKAPIF